MAFAVGAQEVKAICVIREIPKKASPIIAENASMDGEDQLVHFHSMIGVVPGMTSSLEKIVIAKRSLLPNAYQTQVKIKFLL